MERIRLEEKKMTITLIMDLDVHKQVYQNVMNRDRQQYRTITDYVCAAVLNMENGSPHRLQLSEDDRKLLAKEIAGAIVNEKGTGIYPKPAL